MQKNNSKLLNPCSKWEKPELTALEFDLSSIATAMNPGSDAGNGRSSSGS